MAFLNQITDKNGNTYDIKSSITFINKTVSSWASVASNDNDYFEDYPYRGTVNCTGTTSDHIPFVVFAPADVNSGNYASVASSSSNIVYIYGASNNLSPTILNIICIR